MVLKSISLINFRLHKNSSLNFSEKINFIVGGNGQGKTTLLEAIYYLTTTKSFVATTDADAVRFGERSFELNGEFKNQTENKIRIFYSKETGKKQIFLNKKQIVKSSAIIGKFPVVTLTQADHYITKGYPEERRKFVNSVISQASSTYLNYLIEYNRILRQRSSLMQRIKENYSEKLLNEFDAWTEYLISNGVEIVKHRLSFVKEFNEYLKEAYANIMLQEEIPIIKYKFLETSDEKNAEEFFRKELRARRDDELRRAANLVGPHRDEFRFYFNNLELRKFGSQGQHKTFQIALRFAQFFYLKDKLNKTPIFLMDDIFGELDAFRSTKISEYLGKIGQAFITLTDFSNYEEILNAENDKLIKVENGECVYE